MSTLPNARIWYTSGTFENRLHKYNAQGSKYQVLNAIKKDHQNFDVHLYVYEVPRWCTSMFMECQEPHPIEIYCTGGWFVNIKWTVRLARSTSLSLLPSCSGLQIQHASNYPRCEREHGHLRVNWCGVPNHMCKCRGLPISCTWWVRFNALYKTTFQ